MGLARVKSRRGAGLALSALVLLLHTASISASARTLLRNDPELPSERETQAVTGVAALQDEVEPEDGSRSATITAAAEAATAPVAVPVAAGVGESEMATQAPATPPAAILTELQMNNTRDTLLLDLSMIFTQPPDNWQSACEHPGKMEDLWKAKFVEAQKLFPRHLDQHIVAQGTESELMQPEVHTASLTDHTTSTTTQVQIKLPRHVVKLQNAQKQGSQNFMGLLSSMCKLWKEVQAVKGPDGNNLDVEKLGMENARLKDTLSEAEGEKRALQATIDELEKQVAHGKKLMGSLVEKLGGKDTSIESTLAKEEEEHAREDADIKEARAAAAEAA